MDVSSASIRQSAYSEIASQIIFFNVKNTKTVITLQPEKSPIFYIHMVE